jgi:hypothetical protein
MKKPGGEPKGNNKGRHSKWTPIGKFLAKLVSAPFSCQIFPLGFLFLPNNFSCSFVVVYIWLSI